MNENGQADGPRITGAALLGFLKYVPSQPRGDALMEKVIAALPPESAEACKRKVIAVAAYPYSVFVDFIKTADLVMGTGDFKVCYELGKYAASRDAQAFINASKGEVKTEDLFRAAPLLWRSYHLNSGSMKVEDMSQENLVICILDFPAMDPAHCRLMEGYFAQALKETGVEWTNEIRERNCMSKGGELHEFVGRWTSP